MQFQVGIHGKMGPYSFVVKSQQGKGVFSIYGLKSQQGKGVFSIYGLQDISDLIV